MSILALDLGKQTGWAILNGGIIQSGSESFHGSRFSGGGIQFLNFRNLFKKVMKSLSKGRGVW